MMRYRFSLLLAICISYLGFAPSEIRLVGNKLSTSANVRNEFRSPVGTRFVIPNLTHSQILIIQILEANAQEASSTQQGSAYDRYMNMGYEATQKKDYQKAIEAFEKALSERSDDIYAQKALDNVKTYLGQGNKSSNLNTNNNNATLFPGNTIWLIVGLGFLVLALSGALIALLTVFNKRSQSVKVSSTKHQTFAEKGVHKEPPFSPPFFNESNDKYSDNNGSRTSNPEPGFSLPIQNPTRLPSLDLIEELIKTLDEPEPKTRRKAIWKIAQVSDSRAMKPLVDLMVETDSYERSLILEALSQVCTRTLRPMNQALAISLQDKNSQVRKNAIRDLTRLYDLMSQINELLCYALDDENIEVQETAKWALDKLNLRMPFKLNIGNSNDDDDTMFEEDIEEDFDDDTDPFKR